MQALISYMKGSMHASYSSLEDYCCEVMNIGAARSHLCNIISRVSDALARPYEQLQQHIPTEQTLRQAIIDRRITQGSRSLMGRQWNARIWTVLATCRKQGRSSWQFLQNALSAHYFQTSTPSLIPQAN